MTKTQLILIKEHLEFLKTQEPAALYQAFKDMLQAYERTTETFRRLSNRHGDLTLRYQQQLAKVDLLEADLSDAAGEVHHLLQEIKKLQTSRNSAEGALYRTQQDLEKVEGNLAFALNEKEDYRIQVIGLQAWVKKLETQVKVYETTAQDLRNALDDAEASAAKERMNRAADAEHNIAVVKENLQQRDEILDLRAKIKDLNKSLNGAQARIDELKHYPADVARVEQLLREANDEKSRLAGRLHTKEVAHQAATYRLRVRNDELLKDNLDLQSRNEKNRKTISSLNQRLNSAKEALTNHLRTSTEAFNLTYTLYHLLEASLPATSGDGPDQKGESL